MIKKEFYGIFIPVRKFALAFPDFLKFLYFYLKRKLVTSYVFFEKYKNILVRFFMMKRGRYNRPFLHLSTLGVLTVGIISAPFLATTYPVFVLSANNTLDAKTNQQSIAVEDNVFRTDISQKPRDKAITYKVQKGDTISTIAQKFGISEDTIRWENDLSNDNLDVGDSLQMLPITGIAYKVQSGDSVYSIAKKFDTNAQKIVDFPFNDFANPETFTLVSGQILMVPDGIKPSEQPFVKHDAYIAQGPSTSSFSGAGFTWPVKGVLSQFFSWYHEAIDIAAPFNTPVYSSTNGKVVEALTGGWNTGYGNTVVIDDGNGYETRYSHLNYVNVIAGDLVEAGKTLVGSIGLTGRTTGPHLDFTVIKNGVKINPLSVLQ